MTAMRDESCGWGGDPGGLQIGVRAAPAAVRNDGTVTVVLAIRNGSSGTLTVEPRFALVVQRGDVVDEHAGGPRSAEAVVVSAGATLELASWQLDVEQLGVEPGDRVVSVVYRPSLGPELRSGPARIAVLA